MTTTVRRATAADLDFVLAAEHADDNRRGVEPWKRSQHESALADPDFRYLVVETEEHGRMGYIILAGCSGSHRNIEFKRLVITDKGRGFGRVAVRHVKRVAFEELEAHRLWLDVKAWNQRAQHLYQSEGFVREGLLRECLRTVDGHESLVVMSMLEDEYKALNRE